MSDYLGEFVAGESVPVRAQFHDSSGNAADPTSPTLRIEGPTAGTFTDGTTPTKRDGKTGYYGTDVDTSGNAEGYYVARVAGTAGGHVVGDSRSWRIVAARAENLDVPDESWVSITEATLDSSGNALGALTISGVATGGIALTAYLSSDATRSTKIARTYSEGDGGYVLQVPPSATYVLRPSYAGDEWITEEKEVVVP